MMFDKVSTSDNFRCQHCGAEKNNQYTDKDILLDKMVTILAMVVIAPCIGIATKSGAAFMAVFAPSLCWFMYATLAKWSKNHERI